MRNTPLHDNLPSNPLSSNARGIDSVDWGNNQSGSSSSTAAPSVASCQGSTAQSSHEHLHTLDSSHRENKGEDDEDGYEDEEDQEDDEDDEDIQSSETRPVLAKSVQSKRTALRGPGHAQWIFQQKVLLVDEDITLTFTGYQYIQSWQFLYYAACIFSGGIVFLLGRWMPQRLIAWIATTCEMSSAEAIVVENEWGQMVIEPVYTKYYGGPIDSVFSPEQLETPGDNFDKDADVDAATGMMHDMRFFDYQYVRFIFNPVALAFMQNSQWKDPTWSTVASCERGLSREQHQERAMVFGQNMIDVEEKTVGQLLVQEVLHPFYIFQVFSMALWFADDYIYYAACIFVISTVSVITELVETKKTMRRMRAMSRFSCSVKVFRSAIWRNLNSEELVPGDVFEVTDPDLSIFPCDAVLLSGDCIVNESMLTGESVPVSKVPVTDLALQNLDLSFANIPSDIARHFLFSGTKIVRARPGATKPPKKQTETVVSAAMEPPRALPQRGLAMVVRTGFNSTKGSLIRSMLFPKPKDFQFYRDSFRFIGILACIAFGGFLVSTVNFIRMGVPVRLMIIKALDLITIVVPPALPATMSIGTSFAIARLKRSNIFCISPTRVNIGGKINCMCFDKTGTLTEDGLDVLGVQCADSETGKFGDLLSRVSNLQSVPDSMRDRSTSLLYAMATCHSIKSLNGDLIGDPLDLKMFDFTQWVLEEGGMGARTSGVSETVHNRSKGNLGGIVSTVVRPPGGKLFNLADIIDGKNSFLELGISRCFEFVSSLRRMSVIVKRLNSPGMDIYVKGAPEAMVDICRNETLPQDYAERLTYYTHHGYRVIACATKFVPTLNFLRAQRIKRELAESELTFLGFIVFENKLKPTTASIIATLSNAHIRQVMCTGDNVLTAISVSKECSLIHSSRDVYAPRFVSGDSKSEFSKLVWENVNDDRLSLDPLLLKPVSTWSEQPTSGPEFPRYSHLANDYVLAVTGDCFRWMVDYAPTSTLNRMLVKGQIFARMSPDEKHELVELLQGIGYCVGFCGDGANDCGALKAADVGISLSEAEASVAAPFTSRTNEIGCVVSVIKEGRAALVTSFSCFKFMALYSIIQFTTVSFLYAFASNLGDFQFLYIDLALILPIAVFMGRTEAFPVLNPKRPTANLVSKKVLTSLIGHIIIQFMFQGIIFVTVRRQEWYRPPVYHRGEKNIECFENTAMFLLSCFQYLLIAVVFSVGPPFRKPMVSNRPFVVITVALVILSALMVLFPPQWVVGVMQLLAISSNFKVFILFMAGVHLLVAMGSERFVFPVVAGWIGSWMNGRKARSEIKPSFPSRRPCSDDSMGTNRTEYARHAFSPLAGESHRPLMAPDDLDDVLVAAPCHSVRTTTGASSGKIYKMVEEEMRAP
ncbi:hypothetical protein BG004_000252 [Podila humilis]|nr:hypothetical protein BG004_000252 [Podila humilis]